MKQFKKDYLVNKYKKHLNENDLESFESGLDNASEHALSDLLDLELKSKAITLLLSIFLGFLGADRNYIGDIKLGKIKLAFSVMMLIRLILTVMPPITLEASDTTIYLVDIFYVAIINIFGWLLLGISCALLVWWIVDIFVCYSRVKNLNRKNILAAAYAHPGPDTEKTRSYHTDTYKTICFYDKYKTAITKEEREKFKTSLYYVDDGAFNGVENLQLKSKTATLLLSIFLGNWGAGSFYLGNYKRGIFRLVVSLVLLALSLFLNIYAIIYSPDIYLLASAVSLIISIVQLFRLGQEIDMCWYQLKVINGKKIIDELKAYRDKQIKMA